MAVSFTKVASTLQTPSNSSYSDRKWRAAIVVTVASSNATHYKLKVKLYFDGKKGSWGQVGQYVSGSISFNGSTVASFKAGDQSWNYTDLTEKLVLTYTSGNIARTTSVKSIPISGSVRVNSPSAYRNGNTSTTAAYSYSIPALANFKITYNGNGGTPISGTRSIPETITYYYNQSSFSSSGLPDYTGGTWNLERTGYKPTYNWQTAPTNGTLIPQNRNYTTTQDLYQAITGTAWAGTANGSTVTLYAGWELDTIAPTVTANAYRVDDNNNNTANPSGTWVYIDITGYTHGILEGVAQTSSNITVQYKEGNGSYTNLIPSWTNPITTQSASSLSFYSQSYAVTSNFTIKITISNNAGSNYIEIKIPAATLPIDLQVINNNVCMGVMHEAIENNKLAIPGLLADGPIRSTQAGRDSESAFYIENNVAQTDTFFTAARTGGATVSFGVGSGGANHGVWSQPRNKWMIYMNTVDDYVYFMTHLIPSTNSSSTSTGFYIGDSTHRWRQLYSYSAVNTGSDGKNKDVISNLDFAKDLIMNLNPVEFQWKESDHKRSHMGLIAQEAAKAGKKINKNLSFYEAQYIDGSSYNGELVDDNKLQWGIMYTELIAPIIKVIQEQEIEIQSLKQRIEILEKNV